MSLLPVDVPVDPDAAEAREWVLRELSDAKYREAQPSWFDRLVQQFWEWLNSLVFPAGGAISPVGILILLAIVGGIVALAFLVFGLPRLNRRSRVSGSLFGDDDDRDAAALRRASEQAAAASDWSTAIVERFRAIARDLSDRTIVTVSPGTTAHDFAVRAAAAFPGEQEPLPASARTFDEVRYLGGGGSREQYEALVALDGRLRAARPDLAAATA